MSDVQVSHAAIGAACDYLTAIIRIHHPDSEPVTKVRDDHPALQAFARFEQDIISRLVTRPAPVGEPVAWMYEIGGYKHYFTRRQISRINGIAVENYAETPLYTRPALDVDGLVEKVARAMLDSIENGGNITDSLDHLADYPERALSKLATAALAAIKDATDAG